jgi:RNA 2',3'-cyclic 3'-phosphodiesterase
MTAEPMRRLFFALWPGQAAGHALALAARQSCPATGGRAIPEENLHLTLVFLGSVPEARLPQLVQISRDCAAALAGTQPLAVRFSQLEHWPRPQVLVARPFSEPQDLQRLAATLRTATIAAGFTPDLKSFRAHVTVARKVTRPPQPAPLHPIEWHCDRFALMDSRSEGGGSVYSVVEFQTLVKAHKVHEKA